MSALPAARATVKGERHAGVDCPGGGKTELERAEATLPAPETGHFLPHAIQVVACAAGPAT